jgi:hypothetical protein
MFSSSLFPKPSTPRKVSPEIRELCKDLGLGSAKPVFVNIRTVQGAVALDCFNTVKRHVETEGGGVCYGWRIWEIPGVFIEAEFHAVWRGPNGSLLDISKKITQDDHILFVLDPKRIFKGRQRNNVRRALIKHPAINDFFRAADRIFEIWNKGERATKFEIDDLSPAEIRELEELEFRKSASLARIVEDRFRPGPNDPCPCGSGLKYKKCHGR